MPVQLIEDLDSREITGTKDDSGAVKRGIILHYTLEGISDDLTAEELLLNSTAETYNGLERIDYNLTPEWVDTETDDGVWRCTVEYREPDEPETGDWAYTFDTTGGSQHITHSKETISRTAPAGKTATDHNGAIGVSGKGADAQVQGVDIGMTVYNWTETHYIPDADMTPAYKSKIARLTWHYSADPYKGFEGGEVMFRGARGGQRGDEDWEMTFGFSAIENMTNIPIGEITVPVKLGWHYLWVHYEDVEDPASKTIAKRADGAYVERVFDPGDLTELNIGT